MFDQSVMIAAPLPTPGPETEVYLTLPSPEQLRQLDQLFLQDQAEGQPFLAGLLTVSAGLSLGYVLLLDRQQAEDSGEEKARKLAALRPHEAPSPEPS
jgi:hypothetical protein